MEVSRISYMSCHVNVKLVCKYPPYHCVLYEDNEVTWCPVLNINKTRSIAAEDVPHGGCCSDSPMRRWTKEC